MAEEIQEAVQIIRVAYDGIEIAMKVGSGGIAAMQKAIDFLKGMLDYEKSLGKTSMRKLLLKGGDLQVLQFKTEDMRKVERMAKKYGILYSVLPDCNKTDGMSEVIFHTEGEPIIKAFEMEQNGQVKKKGKKTQSEITTSESAVKKQEEFEEMKKKTRNMMFGLAAVFVLAVAGVAAYKAMH